MFRNGALVFGFTSSFRMGQLIRYKFQYPADPLFNPNLDPEKYLATDFMDALRKCLSEGGFGKKVNEVESGGTFLVGFGGKIYSVEGDYQYAAYERPYTSVGVGYEIALGSLYTTAKELTPEGEDRVKYRLLTALRAAEEYNAGVRGPFRYVSTAFDGIKELQDVQPE